MAVPWASAEYGKLRTCAYLPIAIASYNDEGKIIPFKTDSGFEAPFVPTILYDGIMATEEEAAYKVPVPQEYKSSTTKILEIAREYMKDKK